MAVTIPAAYTAIDLVDGAGAAPGTQILAAPLQTVASNHNFLGATHRPTVVKWFHPTGVASSAGSIQNVLVFGIPRNADDPDMAIKIRASNSGSGARVYASILSGAGSTIAYADIGGSTTDVDLSISLDTSTITGSSGMLFIRTSNNRITIHDVLAYWTRQTGSVADTPKSSGFRYAQSAEFAATEPLTVEQMNRLLEAPRAMFNAHKGQVFALADNLTTAVGSGTWKTTRTSIELINRAYIDIRCARVDLSWSVYAVGPSGSQVQIHLSEISNPGSKAHTSAMATTTTALPTNPSGSYSLLTSTMEGVESGLYRMDVWALSGSGGSAVQVYSIMGTQSA